VGWVISREIQDSQLPYAFVEAPQWSRIGQSIHEPCRMGVSLQTTSHLPTCNVLSWTSTDYLIDMAGMSMRCCLLEMHVEHIPVVRANFRCKRRSRCSCRPDVQPIVGVDRRI
jgi:hypothetical protein